MRRIIAALVVTVGLAAGLSACGDSSNTAVKQVSLTSLAGFQDLSKSPLGPATQSVTETDGSTWSYAKPAAGRITLLYFGYTRCPDVCPTTMADVAGALSRIPAADRAKVAVQFVSTDPQRDTPAQIKAWVDGFDPSFVGGRAPIQQVITAAKTYAVGVSAPVKVHGQIQVTHGAQLLVLDPQGQMVGYFGDLAGPKAYAAALPTLIARFA